MNYKNIPAELRMLPQWVCAGVDKVPLNPTTKNKASVTDPSTWGTFDEAQRSGLTHIGFVLTADDPFTIIDMDAPTNDEQVKRHKKILNTFASFTEISQSGQGFHIIVKGNIPSGVRRDKIEIYSSERYMICTGNIYRNLPIVDHQEMLTQIFKEMRPAATVALEDVDSNISDSKLYMIASTAVNADKFNKLAEGDWESDYESQSEADFALLTIIAFYTKSNEQVKRLFRMSALGKRDKALREDYLNRALQKIRSKQIDLEHAKEIAERAIASQPKVAPITQPQEQRQDFPPGLIGDIAQYIYNSAMRPVKEIALIASLGFVSGICGRSYNISGTGINQYLVLLAKTGTGKEAIAGGTDAIIEAVRQTCPQSDMFVGPSSFASGQALIRRLDTQPCFYSILGEFGITMQQLCHPKANSALVTLRKVLLDLYTKSGFNKILRPTAYSDSEKTTEAVQAPSVTIIGESTPETFYEGLTEEQITSGLLPRISIIEYTGDRPEYNDHHSMPPPPELVQRVIDLITGAIATQQNNSVCPITVDEEADKLLRDYNSFCDQKIRDSNTIGRHLWNRGHLKALKLAGLLAVGINNHSPMVTAELVNYATKFVTDEIDRLYTKAAKGELSGHEVQQEVAIRDAIEKYLKMSTRAKASTYKVPHCLLSNDYAHLIPFHYLRRKTARLACFKNDARGAGQALTSRIRELIGAGVIVEVDKSTLNKVSGSLKADVYALGDFW